MHWVGWKHNIFKELNPGSTAAVIGETRQICLVWDEHLSSFGIRRALNLLKSVFTPLAVFFLSPSSHFTCSPDLYLSITPHLPVSTCFSLSRASGTTFLPTKCTSQFFSSQKKPISPDISSLRYTATVTFSHWTLLKQLNARRTPRGIIRELYSEERGGDSTHTYTHTHRHT